MKQIQNGEMTEKGVMDIMGKAVNNFMLYVLPN